MAKRSSLSETDLDVIAEALDDAIEEKLKGGVGGNVVEEAAPLFRARDKVKSMKAGRSDKGTTRPAAQVKRRATAASKAPDARDVTTLGGDPSL